ncbi:MAG: hypothetical protein JWQ96_1685 [Segetibacter sp.]|nr:hypothetical protein [Segetibacter sp.]
MKRFAIFFSLFTLSAFILPGCKKESEDTNLPKMSLVPESVQGKTGQQAQATIIIIAPYGFKKLETSKTINLVSAFGGSNVTPQDLGNNEYKYVFNYTYQGDEVDKLVGINFRFEDARGNVAEKDLTINTEASGSQKIYSRTWKLVSKLWTTKTPVEENITACEKDNRTNWRKDSSILINYGAAGCLFDGFNIFDRWYLSNDEQTFTQVYHSAFDPSKITIEKYKVTTLAPDKLVMEIAYDLTAFGFTNKEIFVFTYEAS